MRKLTFNEFLKEARTIANQIKTAGGELYAVGGCVRDWHLDIMYPKDFDLLLTGLTREQFLELYPTAQMVGDAENGFPVFLLQIAGYVCEVAFARTEKKVGEGYMGFETYTHPTITVEEDLLRRDLTINAMAVNVLTGRLIDPFEGRLDLKKGIIRHVSSAFSEDPLRVLRAARFAARFGFTISKETLAYMYVLKGELTTFKPERVFEETKKALMGRKPSLYFRSLKEAGVLDVHYKEVADLIGVEQPAKFHPEGDVFEHTMSVLDAMAELTDRIEMRFVALVHDFGKADSPQKWERDPESFPHSTHYGHEELGVKHVEALCKRLKLPRAWLRAGVFGAEFHGKMHKLAEVKNTKSVRKIVKMIEDSNRNPIGTKGMALIALADTRGKGNAKALHPYIDFWNEVAKEVLLVKANTELPIKEIADEKQLRQAKLFKTIRRNMLKDNKEQQEQKASNE